MGRAALLLLPLLACVPRLSLSAEDLPHVSTCNRCFKCIVDGPTPDMGPFSQPTRKRGLAQTVGEDSSEQSAAQGSGLPGAGMAGAPGAAGAQQPRKRRRWRMRPPWPPPPVSAGTACPLCSTQCMLSLHSHPQALAYMGHTGTAWGVVPHSTPTQLPPVRTSCRRAATDNPCPWRAPQCPTSLSCLHIKRFLPTRQPLAHSPWSSGRASSTGS